MDIETTPCEPCAAFNAHDDNDCVREIPRGAHPCGGRFERAA